MSNDFLMYYSALVIFVSVLAVASGGWILRLSAIAAIVMSVFVIQDTYNKPKDLQYYLDEGRAVLKKHL